MKLKLISVSLLIIFSTTNLFAWGKIGHRVVGEVATNYLNKKAKKRIITLLEGHSLAEVSNWMDDIKSDDHFDYANDWHWVTIPKGMTYEETEKNENGDLIQTINSLIQELKAGKLSKEKEVQHIKMLIHLVGDIHQPLHVGNGTDLGGNQVKVKWFYQNSNLHRVWDSEMIDGKQYSFTELAEIVDNHSKDQIKDWSNDGIDSWYKEAMELRDQVYDFPQDGKLGYEYSYKNWDTVKVQLAKGGVRLAAILNDIYG